MFNVHEIKTSLFQFLTEHRYIFLDIALIGLIFERAFKFMKYGIKSVFEWIIRAIFSLSSSYYILTPIAIALIQNASMGTDHAKLSDIKITLMFVPILLISYGILSRISLFGNIKNKALGFFDALLGSIFGIMQALFWIYVAYLGLKVLIIIKPETVKSGSMDLIVELYSNLDSVNKEGLEIPAGDKNSEVRDTWTFKIVSLMSNKLKKFEKVFLESSDSNNFFLNSWHTLCDGLLQMSIWWRDTVLIKLAPNLFKKEPQPVVKQEIVENKINLAKLGELSNRIIDTIDEIKAKPAG